MHGAYEAMARGDYRAAAAHGREMARICERVGRPEILTDHSGVLEGTRTGITLEGSSFGATIAAFADSVGRLVHGPEGRLIAVLPAVAAFREDPLPTGIVKAWYKPGISEVGWRPLRMTSTWHSQGVNTAEGRRFSGVGWYRARVTIPAGTDLRAARIAVPGLDAHAATIWCNGNYVGRVERDPRGDISLAIGQQLKTGENLIVLRASTADGGGITIPPFLYRPVQAAEPGDG
jgi:hypothetical protein